jgi:hypothetical protein
MLQLLRRSFFASYAICSGGKRCANFLQAAVEKALTLENFLDFSPKE